MLYIDERLLKKQENGPKVREILEQSEIDVGADTEKKRARLLRTIRDDLGEDAVYDDIIKRLG